MNFSYVILLVIGPALIFGGLLLLRESKKFRKQQDSRRKLNRSYWVSTPALSGGRYAGAFRRSRSRWQFLKRRMESRRPLCEACYRAKIYSLQVASATRLRQTLAHAAQNGTLKRLSRPASVSADRASCLPDDPTS
jgi:hypothetical protein